MFNVFVRNWWKENENYPNGLEPCAGKKTYKKRNVSESEAKLYCKEYNATHNPGRYSRKAEFERA